METAYDVYSQTAEIVLVTPQQAAAWLRYNSPKQRNQVDGWVTYLANTIRSGGWYLTHQGIAFDCDGELVDGQHRLNAIILADTPAYLWVIRGLSKEAMQAIDRGKTRSLLHVMQTAGLTVSNDTIAIMRILIGDFHSGRAVVGGQVYHSLTDALAIEAIAKHHDALGFSQQRLSRSYGSAVARAAIARAYYYESPDLLGRFCLAASDTIPAGEITEQDQLVRKFRDSITKNGDLNNFSGRLVCHRKWVHCIRQYCAGKLTTRVYEATSDPYPIPAHKALTGDAV